MHGEIVHYSLHDVGADLDIDRVVRLLDEPTRKAPLVARSPLPRYAGYREPIEVGLSAGRWGTAPPGATVEVRLHSIGVVAVRIRVPVDVAEISGLAGTAEAARIGDRPLDVLSKEIYREVRDALQPYRLDPYDIIVEPEPYLVYVFTEGGAAAGQMLDANRSLIAALIEGERDPRALAASTVERTLRYTVQYLSTDAVVLGWDRALIVAPDGQYEDTLDVIELANLELLELRTYDAYLDRRLTTTFSTLERLWDRRALFRSARKTLQEISEMRIEFSRLTDNLHDTHKLFGDWYVATIHQALAQRFHLDDWHGAVTGKMDTLEDLFASASEEVNHRRALILESMIVLLFIIDLVAIFALK